MTGEVKRRVYGRRFGRKLRDSQKELLAEVMPKVRVPVLEPGARLDPARLFETPKRDFWLEIGFGGGEHLVWQADQNPDVGLIGAEPFLNGVVSGLGHIHREQVTNVRVWPDDARPLMDALPDGCLGRAFILFPDPWPKKRHNSRRFVQKENLDSLARLLRPGAELRMASDDQDYVAWMLAETTPHPAFAWLAEGPSDWRERPRDWPATRYEEKARAKGIHPSFLRFQRRAMI
ncbi:tRNA (guanine-N7)-methyltransferase [Elstera litoralis]|uniref:tRNA (guanine-N(7)-)-methyltransferase n=1 Tax=Elstera litoralis TaxID=552518 RepID=A0A0F3IV81_9PROT|nr:tRNA (guanine(46)-N(7))-methyltransferase TrmB [Elstera litoralis]KJV10591.1 tRNA (guanine-N7)-methyltransferase [Elstera litoralis]